MFILQRYKYYILNQKKSEKNSWNCKKNERAGECRSPARYYEKKVLFHELANDDSTADRGAEYVSAYNAPRHPPRI